MIKNEKLCSFEGDLIKWVESKHEEIADYFIFSVTRCVQDIINTKFDTILGRILEEEVKTECKKHVNSLVKEKVNDKYSEMESSIDQMIEDHLKKKIDNYFDQKRK